MRARCQNEGRGVYGQDHEVFSEESGNINGYPSNWDSWVYYKCSPGPLFRKFYIICVRHQRRSIVAHDQRKIREHYLGIGLSIGTALGVAVGAGLGVALRNLALGISLGISLGIAFGGVFGSILGNKHAKMVQQSSQTDGRP
jgi:hypothetical protein